MARRTTSKTSTTKRTAAPRKSNSSKAVTDQAESAEATAADVAPAREEADAPPSSPQAEERADSPPDAAKPALAAEADKGIEASAEPVEDQATAEQSAAPDALADTPVTDTAAANSIENGPETPPESAVVDSAAPAETAQNDTAQPPAPDVASPQKSGGFVPMLLGGVLAAGLGYGAHYLQTGQVSDANSELDAIVAELADLRALVAQGPDLSALESQITALEPAQSPDLAPLNAAIDDLRNQIAALPDLSAVETQIAELRAAPDVDLGPLETAVSALETAYGPVPDQMAALQADMADLRALATEDVALAEAAVDLALAQSGLDRIAAALVTGAPFADATAQLTEAGITIAEPIAQAAADGVQTLEALQESYGDAARAAIAASLQTAPADSATEKLGNFFRAQVGARSLAPREGDDPDAVTSRAGAAVETGDLGAALQELAALPEDGRVAMDAWLTNAQTRLDVAEALDALQADMATR